MAFAHPAVRPPRSRRRVRHRSIRTLLIVLVAACVFPSFGALGIIVYDQQQQGRKAIESETLLRARGLMAIVDRDLAIVQSSLEVLASSHRLMSTDLSRFAERLRSTPRSLIVLNYVVVGRDGKQVLNASVPMGTPMSDEVLPDAVRRVFTTGEPSVSTLFEAPIHRRRSLSLTVPVRQDSEIVYGLSAELAPSQLGRLLVREPLPDGWIAALLDSRGTIVARSRGETRFFGQQAGAELRADLARRTEGSREGVGKEGFAVISAYSRSTLSGLSVVILAPQAALSTKLSSSLMLLLGGGTLVLAVALWFATRLARDISLAVEGLIEPALALGSGRSVLLPPTTLKEAEAVGRAIEQAAGMLAIARHQAHHDALTGLANRLLFDEVAAHQIAVARRSGQRLAILAIDLDGFKAVNDRHGHAVGDHVLRIVAERIAQSVRVSDVVSRRGGDEFTVLLNDVHPVLARQIGDKLVHALSTSFPDVTTTLSASIGIAMYPEGGASVAELLEAADAALYAAKKSGKRRMACAA